MKALVLLSTSGPESVGHEALSVSAAHTSVAWPAANRALLVPLYITEPSTVVKLWWMNGAAVSGNVDIGIYRVSDLSRIVSSGSTAQAGTSALQEVDITDTPLAPGTYYLGLACDNTTATFIRLFNDLRWCRAFGVVQQTSAFPLPATAVPEACASAYVPLMGASLRTLVA